MADRGGETKASQGSAGPQRPYRPTILPPPPPDPNKAAIENALEVTELAVLGPVSRSVASVHIPTP
jgi:hypothetical protein